MNISNPQTELPRNGLGFTLSGGADLWDEGAAGGIITDDFFEAVPSNKFWLKVSGTWKEAVTWIKVSGTWKQATPNIKVSGTWR